MFLFVDIINDYWEIFELLKVKISAPIGACKRDRNND